jgi:hypothetical protein
VTVSLHAIETRDFVQQGCSTTPLVQQCQGLRKSRLMVELRKTDHIAAAATAVAVEQILAGIHQEAGLAIGVQRARPHPSAAAEPLHRSPIVCFPPASVTVEQILAGIDIEGRAAFPM